MHGTSAEKGAKTTLFRCEKAPFIEPQSPMRCSFNRLKFKLKRFCRILPRSRILWDFSYMKLIYHQLLMYGSVIQSCYGNGHGEDQCSTKNRKGCACNLDAILGGMWSVFAKRLRLRKKPTRFARNLKRNQKDAWVW